jgi:hypothetical protein
MAESSEVIFNVSCSVCEKTEPEKSISAKNNLFILIRIFDTFIKYQKVNQNY